jgi:hypothetical protein
MSMPIAEYRIVAESVNLAINQNSLIFNGCHCFSKAEGNIQRRLAIPTQHKANSVLRIVKNGKPEILIVVG